MAVIGNWKHFWDPDFNIRINVVFVTHTVFNGKISSFFPFLSPSRKFLFRRDYHLLGKLYIFRVSAGFYYTKVKWLNSYKFLRPFVLKGTYSIGQFCPNLSKTYRSFSLGNLILISIYFHLSLTFFGKRWWPLKTCLVVNSKYHNMYASLKQMNNKFLRPFVLKGTYSIGQFSPNLSKTYRSFSDILRYGLIH
jgi:hypothetical protein